MGTFPNRQNPGNRRKSAIISLSTKTQNALSIQSWKESLSFNYIIHKSCAVQELSLDKSFLCLIIINTIYVLPFFIPDSLVFQQISITGSSKQKYYSLIIAKVPLHSCNKKPTLYTPVFQEQADYLLHLMRIM
jgi:hypothetical protein